MSITPPSRDRITHTYTVPHRLAQGGAFESIGLVELNAEQEIFATKRAKGDPVRLAWELAKECLVQVNGKAVSEADGSRDSAWEGMGPKLRNLVLSAYNDLHAPEDADAASFLGSRKSAL